MTKKIQKLRENNTGRNTHFKVGSQTLTRAQLAQQIKNGHHPDYHVRKINGLNTPVSNPDNKKSNNLG